MNNKRESSINRTDKKGRFFFWGLVFFAIIAVVFAVCVYQGVILPNNPSEEKYPVRGIDVSAYQGRIDWQVIAGQNIDFAFIKATEGSSFTDNCFVYNYEQAQKAGLAVGAYHFFSYDSKGKTQAEHYINTVEPFDGMLPPVIDVEFYGEKEKNPPEREDVGRELNEMLAILEKQYGVKPILYATPKAYRLYLAEDYRKYDIWIRNVVSFPHLPDNREWTFWQYTNRKQIDGYFGEEKFIDFNVFCGTKEEFLQYPRYRK